MMECHHGMCGTCRGIKKLVVGAVLLINAFLWPMWLGIDGWVKVIAILMVVGGVARLVKPMCPHCKMPHMESKGRRK